MTHTPQFHSITTLAEIRATLMPDEIWEPLLAILGKTKADDEPLPLLTILDSVNAFEDGIDDVLWVFRVPALRRLSLHFQAWFLEQLVDLYEVQHPNDSRVRDQIAMLRNDSATMEEREAALEAFCRAQAAEGWDPGLNLAREAAWGARERQLRLMCEA